MNTDRNKERSYRGVLCLSAIARINVAVENRHYIALFDTGTGANFIRQDLVSEKIESVVSGFSTRLAGTCSIKMKIEGRAFMTEFIVISIISDCPWLGQMVMVF